MMARSKPFVQGRIGAALVRLLVFSLMLVVAGFAASHETKRRVSAFETDSQSVLGTVTGKSSETSGVIFYLYVALDRNELYSVDVTFNSLDGKIYHQSTNVSKELYEETKIGSPIKVTYVRSHPDWLYVANQVPTDRDVGIFITMFHDGMIMSFILAVILTASVFWYRDGEGLHLPFGREAQKRELSSRIQRLQDRAGLGKTTSKSLMSPA
jgi:hypothetical protein